MFGAACSSDSSPTPPASTVPPPTIPAPCQSAVDDLSNELSAATDLGEVPRTVIGASLRTCDPASWQGAAERDRVQGALGGLGDVDGPLTVREALDLLCTRFDAARSTQSCKPR
jgi:hypothetical protein